jgi:hypothetical protein
MEVSNYLHFGQNEFDFINKINGRAAHVAALFARPSL